MKSRVIYNVEVSGYSVGLTFDLREAQTWVRGNPNGKIRIVKYNG